MEGCMMLVRIWRKWNRNKSRIFIIFVAASILIGITGLSMCVYAQKTDIPDGVIVVKNEKEMLNKLISGMKKHQSYFAFYYPNVERDFDNDRKQAASYKGFMDKLAAKNGYMTGILSGACIMIRGVEDKYITFQFNYLTTKKQDKKIDRIARSVARKYRKGSRAARAKKAHDYLVRHMRYDSRYYNPYDAFTKGKGICMSYALAYQRLMQEMKIPCIYIKGKNHAWNMVKINSIWYNVDVTWDDVKGGYRYFLKADKDFPGHKRPKSKWLSSLKKAKHSYNLKKIR